MLEDGRERFDLDLRVRPSAGVSSSILGALAKKRDLTAESSFRSR